MKFEDGNIVFWIFFLKIFCEDCFWKIELLVMGWIEVYDRCILVYWDIFEEKGLCIFDEVLWWLECIVWIRDEEGLEFDNVKVFFVLFVRVVEFFE